MILRLYSKALEEQEPEDFIKGCKEMKTGQNGGPSRISDL